MTAQKSDLNDFATRGPGVPGNLIACLSVSGMARQHKGERKRFNLFIDANLLTIGTTVSKKLYGMDWSQFAADTTAHLMGMSEYALELGREQMFSFVDEWADTLFPDQNFELAGYMDDRTTVGLPIPVYNEVLRTGVNRNRVVSLGVATWLHIPHLAPLGGGDVLQGVLTKIA